MRENLQLSPATVWLTSVMAVCLPVHTFDTNTMKFCGYIVRRVTTNPWLFEGIDSSKVGSLPMTGAGVYSTVPLWAGVWGMNQHGDSPPRVYRRGSLYAEYPTGGSWVPMS